MARAACSRQGDEYGVPEFPGIHLRDITLRLSPRHRDSSSRYWLLQQVLCGCARAGDCVTRGAAWVAGAGSSLVAVFLVVACAPPLPALQDAPAERTASYAPNYGYPLNRAVPCIVNTSSRHWGGVVTQVWSTDGRSVELTIRNPSQVMFLVLGRETVSRSMSYEIRRTADVSDQDLLQMQVWIDNCSIRPTP